MTQEFLDGADVVPGLEQVGRKRVPESVAAHLLCDACSADSLLYRTLDQGLVDVVPALLFRPGVLPALGLGEHPLPAPITGSV